MIQEGGVGLEPGYNLPIPLAGSGYRLEESKSGEDADIAGNDVISKADKAFPCGLGGYNVTKWSVRQEQFH